MTLAPACFSSCRFTFSPNFSPYTIGTPDVAFTGPIASRNKKVGHVDSTGEAYLVIRGKLIPISKYAPDDLRQQFSPSFFKSLSVDEVLYPSDLSGVGHEVPPQNQADFLHGKCVVLPLRSYQVLDHNANVVENVHPKNDFVDCVAFEVKLPHH